MEIAVKHLCKSFGGRTVLRDLTFTAGPGITAVMAPSGTGKTTLLRILLGLERPDSGTVEGLAGKRLTAVFQEDRLLEHLSAEGNLRFVLGRVYDPAAARALLDRLDYMKKGGRCSTATALGASLLKLHPCLDVVDGKLPVTKKYRGSIEKVVEEYVRDRLRDRADLDTHRAFLVDTCPDDHLASIAREVLRQDGRFQEIIEAKAGCTIFCHCGPGTLGVIFLRKA